MKINIRMLRNSLRLSDRTKIAEYQQVERKESNPSPQGRKYVIETPLPLAAVQILIPEGYGSLNDKDLVMAFRALDKDQNELHNSVIQLPFSSALKAPYSYLTYRDQGQLVLSTKSFEISEDVHTIHAELLPWTPNGKKVFKERTAIPCYSILRIKGSSQNWIGEIKSE